MIYLNTLGTISIVEIILLKAAADSESVFVLNGSTQANLEKQSITHRI